MAYDPRKAADKQIRRAQSAGQDYVEGVNSTQKNPMQLAKAKKEKYRAGVQAALDSGKWEAGLDSVSPEEWKRITAKKGGERYAAGVADAAPKIAAFHEEFSVFMAAHKAKIDSLPDTTPEQRIQKMVENARGIAKFQRRKIRR